MADAPRILHTADWQLGMTRHFLDAEAQARFATDRLAAVERLCEIAGEEHCAGVVVAGDVFETNLVGERVVAPVLEVLRESPVPVVLLPGNHDPLDPTSVYTRHTFVERRPPNVVVLDSDDPVTLDGVEVRGAPWRSKRPGADLVGELLERLGPSRGRRRVVVAHGPIAEGGLGFGAPHAISVAAVERAVASGTLSYLALGDRHSRTSVGTSGAIWYAGTPEATDYDEVAPGDVLVVELHPTGAVVRPRTVGRWRFLRRRFDLNGPRDLEELRRWLDDLPGKTRTVVKLDLVGSLTIPEREQLDAMLEAARPALGALERSTRFGRVVVRPERADADELGLAGYVREAFDELSALAAGEDAHQAELAARALVHLYRLSGGAQGR